MATKSTQPAPDPPPDAGNGPDVPEAPKAPERPTGDPRGQYSDAVERANLDEVLRASGLPPE